MSARRRILAVMGTRPEVIKLAPVIRALRFQKGISVRVCATAQHRALADEMLAAFGIRPDHDLDVMSKGQTPLDVLRRSTAGLETLLRRSRFDLVLVQGDTTTALAAALTAFHLGVPVGHVEAGLRSGDLNDPFPEEANRILVDRVSALHFAPTPGARKNLLSEGLPASGIFVTGNTVVDALRSTAPLRRRTRGAIPAQAPYVVVTMHRRESFGEPARRVFLGLIDLVERKKDLRVYFPVHPNPNVRKLARSLLRHPRIRLLPPAGYVPFLRLLEGSELIMTDSGGIVEEAASLNKPVLILRRRTERPELVERGGALIVGTDRIGIKTARLLSDRARLGRMARVRNPYGDGRAGERIARIIARRFGFRSGRIAPFRP